MRRTEQVQGLRLMKFEEVYGRTHRDGLSQAEAAEVLGVSERTFRRWRERYEAEGADGRGKSRPPSQPRGERHDPINRDVNRKANAAAERFNRDCVVERRAG